MFSLYLLDFALVSLLSLRAVVAVAAVWETGGTLTKGFFGFVLAATGLFVLLLLDLEGTGAGGSGTSSN